jgi:hypothetical protein
MWRSYQRLLLSLAVADAMSFACARVSLAGEFCQDCGRCPPPYVHYQEGPPRLKFKCDCPRPVCGPCDLKHYGYYPTCWVPFPGTPDYSSCPVPTITCVTLPDIGPAAAGSVSKLPETEFKQPPGKNLGQTSPFPPSPSALPSANSTAHPSPYHGQGPAPEPGR